MSMADKRLSALLASALVVWAGAAAGQQLTEQAAATTPQHDQGTTIKPAAQVHFDAADRAAGRDFTGALGACDGARPPGLKRRQPGAARPEPVRSEPYAQVFDNLYFFTSQSVAAWAVATPDGIILIDALDNQDEIMSVVEPGLRKFGLDPAQIKYVVVTHGHGDHFGGSAYLATKYHARVMMSDLDWTLAPTMLDKPTFNPPPPRDLVIKDGDKLTLGGETISLYLTPGHTRGTVSLLIPVTDRGRKHVAGLWGGAGFNFPHSPERFQTYADSIQHFAGPAAAAGADVPLSNHPVNDDAVRKAAAMTTRGGEDPNPFVMGRDGMQRYLTTFSECALAYKAQISN